MGGPACADLCLQYTIPVASPHRRFYDYATRWMVNEVNLHKLRQAGSKDISRMAKMFVNAQRGRLGMRLTQHEREGGNGQGGSGRGWPTQERAADAW